VNIENQTPCRFAGLPGLQWLALTICLSLLSAYASAQTYSFHITPANPTTTDLVFLHGESSHSPFAFGLTRQNNSFFVGFQPGTKAEVSRFVLPLGVLPAGRYAIIRGLPEVEFTVTEAPVVRTDLNLDGVWSNPQQPGRALYLVQSDTTLAGGWLVHGTNKLPVWYLVQGVWVTPRRFNGSLSTVIGSDVQNTYVPVTQKPAGAMSITFNDAGSGTMTYYVGATTAEGTSVPITRFHFK